MESGYQPFAQNFRECCMRSCSRLAFERGQADAECEAASQEANALYKLIEEKLGADDLLINRFDTAKNHEQSMDNPLIYQQGFQDCVYLLRWIGLL